MTNDLQHEWTRAKNALSKCNNAEDIGKATDAVLSARKALEKAADSAAAAIKTATDALLKEIEENK